MPDTVERDAGEIVMYDAREPHGSRADEGQLVITAVIAPCPRELEP